MLDLDLRLLRSFVELAQDRSFTRAAARLHMTQPALSLQIQKLEAQVGVVLFRRSTRAVELTQEGSELLAQTIPIVDQTLTLERAIQRMQRGGIRNLHVGAASYTADLPKRNRIIDRFIAENPDSPIAIHPGSQSDLIADVERRKLDVAFVMGMGVPRAQYDSFAFGRTPSEGLYPIDLQRCVITRRPVEILVPFESPLNRLKSIPPSALKGQQLAMNVCAEGRPILEPIASVFIEAGASIFFPPEAHIAASVERYGRLKRIPVLYFGWFNLPRGGMGEGGGEMVRKPIAGFSAETELALIAPESNLKPSAEKFLQLACETSDKPGRSAHCTVLPVAEVS